LRIICSSTLTLQTQHVPYTNIEKDMATPNEKKQALADTLP